MADNCITNLGGEKSWQAGSSAMPSDGAGHGLTRQPVQDLLLDIIKNISH